MKAETYLNQIKKLEAMIKNKAVERKRWLDIARSCGTFNDNDPVQTQRNPNKMSDAIINSIEIENEIDCLKFQRQVIIKTIESLPTLQYDVLHKIYVQDWSLTDIADFYDKSYSWATKEKSKGLNLVQDILDAQTLKV